VITFGTFRNAARGAAGPPGVPQPPVRWANTAATRGKAVRRYHRIDLAAAEQALDDAFSKPTWSTPSNAGKALVARQLFALYVQQDRAAGFPFADVNVKRDVTLGSARISADVDVVVFDPGGGLRARVLLWDIPACSWAQATVIGAVAVLAVDGALGFGRTVGVDVWHLRSAQQHSVTRAEALAALPEAGRVAQLYDV
jgi:hypothetical protein